MDVLWTSGPATVEEVIASLDSAAKPAHNTVLTLLRILEKKGHVRHRREGRAFRFEPLIDRNGARHSAVRHLLSRFFNGSPGLLMQSLIEHELLSGADLDDLRKLVAG